MTHGDDASPAHRSALVTGGSSGIGLAVASMLAGEGYDLTLVGRDTGRLESAARSMAPFGHGVQTVALDVAAEGAAERMASSHVDQFGGLDCVVACAGVSLRAPLVDTDQRSLRALLEVHVESVFDLSRTVMPLMRRDTSAAPSWFVLMSSMAGLLPVAQFAAYSAAKAAVISLARSINEEESAHGVRACAICPGFVDTPLTAPLADAVGPDEMIRPSDVAEAVRFLLTLSSHAVVSRLVIERAGAPPLQP